MRRILAALLCLSPLSAMAGFATGYACNTSRVPTSNTSIHGDFGYIRTYLYSSSTCTGTVLQVVEFLTNGATTSGTNSSWVYAEQEIASLYAKLADASMGKTRVRVHFEDATLSICGSNCRQGRYVEFGVP